MSRDIKTKNPRISTKVFCSKSFQAFKMIMVGSGRSSQVQRTGTRLALHTCRTPGGVLWSDLRSRGRGLRRDGRGQRVGDGGEDERRISLVDDEEVAALPIELVEESNEEHAAVDRVAESAAVLHPRAVQLGQVGPRPSVVAQRGGEVEPILEEVGRDSRPVVTELLGRQGTDRAPRLLDRPQDLRFVRHLIVRRVLGHERQDESHGAVGTLERALEDRLRGPGGGGGSGLFHGHSP